MEIEKSTTAGVSVPSTNGRKIVRKAKKFADSANSPTRRQSLQLLQPVAGSQTQLIGSDGVIRLSSQASKTPKRKLGCEGKHQPKKVFKPDGGSNFTIFEDTSKVPSSSSSSAEQEVLDMLTSEKPSEKYWEELAEERRLALQETLKENEELHVKNAELKEENERLKVMADQAEYLADVVETLIGKQAEKEDEGDEEEEEEEEEEEDGRQPDEDAGEDDERESDCKDSKTCEDVAVSHSESSAEDEHEENSADDDRENSKTVQSEPSEL